MMTNSKNSSAAFLNSRIRRFRPQDPYLRELNEDLKFRKHELVAILKPLEEKNGTLLQSLLTNLEEKQKSLQIMRQILAEKGCDSDDTLVLEMIKEAEDLKRNLEKKNKLLRREMEMQRNQQATEDEFRMQQKAMLLRGKAEMQKLKERLQRDNQPVIPEEEVDDIQELHRRVIEEKIDILTKPKKANDMQLFYNLKQKLESPTLSSKFLIDPRYSGLSSAELKLSCECGLSRVLKERNDAKSRIRLDIQESLQKAALKKAGFLRGTSGEEPPSRRCPPSSAHPRTLHSFFQAPYRSLPLLSGRGRQFSRGGARSPPESSASVAQQRARCPRSAPCTLPGCSGLRLRYPDLLWQKVQEED